MRPARHDEARALMELERAAGLAALGHIFAAEAHPYPSSAVEQRWQSVLADTSRVTLLEEDEDGLAVLLSHDGQTLHHLAVRPDLWGRGRATRALECCSAAGLWCLVDNARARGFYERRGWSATEEVRAAEWPPYPREVRYSR